MLKLMLFFWLFTVEQQPHSPFIPEIFAQACLNPLPLGVEPRTWGATKVAATTRLQARSLETNVIETVTPEEYIRDTFQKVSDSEKE